MRDIYEEFRRAGRPFVEIRRGFLSRFGFGEIFGDRGPYTRVITNFNERLPGIEILTPDITVGNVLYIKVPAHRTVGIILRGLRGRGDRRFYGEFIRVTGMFDVCIIFIERYGPAEEVDKPPVETHFFGIHRDKGITVMSGPREVIMKVIRETVYSALKRAEKEIVTADRPR